MKSIHPLKEAAYRVREELYKARSNIADIEEGSTQRTLTALEKALDILNDAIEDLIP